MIRCFLALGFLGADFFAVFWRGLLLAARPRVLDALAPLVFFVLRLAAREDFLALDFVFFALDFFAFAMDHSVENLICAILRLLVVRFQHSHPVCAMDFANVGIKGPLATI